MFLNSGLQLLFRCKIVNQLLIKNDFDNNF